MNNKFAIAGFFCFIVGILLFFNAGMFIPSNSCGGTLYGIQLYFAMGYEIATGLVLLGGLIMLVSNLAAAKGSLGAFTLIVIIGIAIVILLVLSLGVFNGSALCGTSCVAAPGFLCQNTVLGTDGNLSLNLGQSTGATFYNVGIGCAATANSDGQPNPAKAIVYPRITNATLNLTSDEILSISGLKCFSASGTPLAAVNGTANAIGLGFYYQGGLWINYTLNSTAPSASNPVFTQKVASVETRVSYSFGDSGLSAQSLSYYGNGGSYPYSTSTYYSTVYSLSTSIPQQPATTTVLQQAPPCNSSIYGSVLYIGNTVTCGHFGVEFLGVSGAPNYNASFFISYGGAGIGNMNVTPGRTDSWNYNGDILFLDTISICHTQPGSNCTGGNWAQVSLSRQYYNQS